MYSNFYFKTPKACRTKAPHMATDLNRSFRPKMNVKQTEELISLEFSLVGVLKDDMQLTIKDRILSLKASRKQDQDKRYQYREFGPVEFKTQVELPEDIVMESLQAKLLNGVLSVLIARAKKAKLEIEIK